ncbi:hypothetical protein F6U93_06900 [Tamlana haliotis]|uniref:Uncharacterized protein n=1 Tax=Pseudotamlana haliotis TaxID=2614804 RepID=A0A6N6MCS3_9FLAO|nr:hypothetical protein F6U93_06900 [Tamlana haliotis]
MKKALKVISLVSIFGFLVLWVLNKFSVEFDFNTVEIQSIFVLIYLVSSLKYYKMSIDDKDTEIENLKAKLNV